MIDIVYNPFGDVANNLFTYGGYFMALVVLGGITYLSIKLLMKIYKASQKY